MPGALYLVDSNVLLRWIKPDDRDYPLVVSAIEIALQNDAVLCYTSQNVGEFWNTCTRPIDRDGYALSPQETDRRAKFFEEKLRLLPDSLAAHEEWRKLLVTSGVSGVQVHDARLAAAMRVHGVKRIVDRESILAAARRSSRAFSRWCSWSSSRSRIRALCNCDFESPTERPNISAISLCWYPWISCKTNIVR